MSKFSGFKYTGGGSLYLAGVPARHISYDEAKENGWHKKDLLASGLYEEVPAEDAPAADKEPASKKEPGAPAVADSSKSGATDKQ